MGQLALDDGRGLSLVNWIHRREHSGYSDSFDTFLAHIRSDFLQLGIIQGGYLPAVELMSASRHVGETADGVFQIIGPVYKWRKQLGGG